MEQTSDQSHLCFFRSLPDMVLLAAPLPSKQGIPCSLASTLGSGLGLPMSQLNLPRIVTLVSLSFLDTECFQGARK